ncbi:hypothetical protein GCM10010912_58700 [Paenibacillus albidus]|uniref:Uncharacterized protein n=1 Tax=Paenibacillus albidus TaxID=2041023 RepID=A0A917D0X9_9BACL|nr:hypothetical protein [Paenibacillus albidus]GGG06356.1 hypothetical protein GCM10010912_58700 [Paenibacillus albidus]
MRKRIGLLTVILMMLIGMTSSVVQVQAASSQVMQASDISGVKTASALPTPTTAPNGAAEPAERETSWYIPDWVDDMIHKVDEMIQSFKDLMSGKLIKDAIEGLIVLLVDELMTPLYDAFAKSYLFTPQIAEIALVQSGWSIFMIIGLVSLFIGISWLAFKIIKGKKDLGSLLKVFLICFVATYFSLTALNIANVGINWMASKMFEGIIGTSSVTYEGLDGQQILKAMIVGSDGITEASYAAQTLGELTASTSGGIFSLLSYLLLVVLPLYIVAVLKTLVLMFMAILVNLWITQSAYTGKLETMIGFANLYLRTLIVGLICGLHWAIFVKMQTDYGEGTGFSAAIGIPPIIFAILSALALLVFFFFFWIKPLMKAAQSPMTLNGANVVESMGKWGERTSTSLDSMGKRMGSEGVQKKALSMKEGSKRMQEAAKRMRTQRSVGKDKMVSNLTGGLSESVQGIVYQEPEQWLEEGGQVHIGVEHELAFGESEIKSSALNISTVLGEEGFRSVSLLQAPVAQRKKLTEKLSTLKKEYKEDVQWDESTGELILAGETLDMLPQLQKEGFNVSDVREGMYKDGAFVDLNNTPKITKLEDSSKAEQAVEQIKESLPLYTQAKLPQDKASAAYHALQDRTDEYPWVKELLLEQGALWVPDDYMEEATEVLEGMMAQTSRKIRCNFPRHSQFAASMLDEWRRSSTSKGLSEVLELAKDESHVFVPEELLTEFQKAYDSYRKDRTPYWRAKDGTVYVIKDRVPVNYGQPPLDGLDMGSFEKLQKEMLHRHEQQREKESQDAKKKEALSKSKTAGKPKE